MNVAISVGLIIISVLGCRADASGVELQTQAMTNVFETPAMPEVMPEMGSLKTVAAGIAGVTNFPADSKSFMLVFNVKPAEAKKGKFGISFLPEKGDQAACEFQLRLDDMRAQFARGSLTNFAGSQKTLREGAAPHHVGDYAIENLIGDDQPFTVRVIVKGDDKLGGSLIDAEIAGQRTMISYRADLTVKKMVIRAEGVELKNVQIASLKSAIAGHAGEHTKGTKPEAARTCETTSLPPPIAEPQPGEILFCERNPGRDYAGHYYANFGYDCGNETYWLHGADGGRLAIYSPMTGSVRTLLEDPTGAVRDPQIHYDGKKVLFSYRKGGTHHYNLYEMNLDGTDLRQITQGDWDDVEPAYLPDGGIVFCSTRCKRYVLCWLAPVAVLFRCNADGSGLRQLSSNNVSENTPAVLPDGRILYTRWEYVNRDAVSFHHLWTMNPDGTGVMVYYGNMHPGGVFIDAQPIPNTANVVFVDSGYHGQLEHAGELMVLSLHNGPDDRSQAKPITGDGFRDPYPLSEHEFLAARGSEIVTVTDDGGAWEVQFDPNWFYPDNGTGGKVRFEQLTDWTQRPEESVRYFSGTATYKTTFESKLKNTKSRVFLDLGVVKNVARVRLNGRDLGSVWTAPWRVEIGGALEAGANRLEIEVANLWPNRLIGDATLPIEKRRTVTNVRTYDTMASGTYDCTKCAERKKSGQSAAMLPSGLLGPVQIQEQ